MSSRTDALYLSDISDSIEAIFKYVDGISFESFKHDRMRYSAVIREFEIIGEAVGKLSPETTERTPQVPWQDIKDFRNLLIHEYFGVDLEIVWSVIFNELAELRQAVVSGQALP